MTPERRQRILEVFYSACGQPPTQAADFVRAECGQDAEMCSEVLRMLEEHARGRMIDRSPWDDPTATERAPGQPVFPPGQLVSGRYRIVRFLDRGGMGEVYEAEDLELKDRVALKTLLPAIASDGRMIARFKQEIQLSRKVSHPNVCRVFDLARHPADGSAAASTVFLTMEFLAGETLSARLHREGRLSMEEALPILSQTAEALDAAHRAGVIHRDFKPSNVMLVPSADGTRAVVTDFGLARSCGPSSETTATLTGTLMGTRDYMAPELLAGGAATVASDVYAFGTVAYKMVTGVLPFAADAPSAGAILRSKGRAPSPRTLAPDLDEKWEQAIVRALDPDPERRFAQPGHLIKALQGEAPSVTAGAPKATRRRLTVSVVAVVLLAGGGIAWREWLRSRNQPSAEGLRWYQTGAAALRDATYYRAARALERSVSIDPGFALAHARLAEAWNELDDSERAQEEMLRALADQSSHPPARKADALYVDAIHRTLVGDYPGAITAYTALAGKITAAEMSQVLVDLGRARERNDEVDKALGEYLKAERRDPQNAASHLRAAILLGSRQSKYDAATAEFDQADSLYQALSNTEGQAEVLLQRGLLASAAHKLPEARAAVEKAIQLARAISAEHQEIAATLQLGVVTYLEGNAAGAEQIASETLERARRSGLANLAARGLTDLGIARAGRGDYSGGEGSFREAIDLARRFRLHRNEARARLQLSSVLEQQGKAQTALQEIEPALAYYRQAGFRLETSLALTVLARSHRDLGNFDQARTEFEQLLSLAAAADDRRQMMAGEQGVASVLYQVDRWPEALGRFEHHYELASQLRDRAATGIGLLNQVKILWRLGRYPDAEKALAEASTLSTQPGSDIRLPSLIAAYGAEMALSRNLFPEALALAQKVLRMGTATKQIQATAGCVAGLARARAGSVQDGKRLCDEGVSAASGLGDQAILSDTRLALAEILVAGGQPKAAEELARSVLDSLREAGRKESVWRCGAILARAYRRDGDPIHSQEAAGHAAAGLAELRSLWDAADFERYRQRRDIQSYLKEVSRINETTSK
jgi:tetratricopeptide (TPR) repeat protein